MGISLCKHATCSWENTHFDKTLTFLWLEYIWEELDWLDTVDNLAQEQEVSHDHIGNIGIK